MKRPRFYFGGIKNKDIEAVYLLDILDKYRKIRKVGLSHSELGFHSPISRGEFKELQKERAMHITQEP